MATTQECCKQYWTVPGGNTRQSSSCTATYHPSRKLSKLDETARKRTLTTRLKIKLPTNHIKSLMATTQECCKQYWTVPGSSTCMATYHPSRKLSKLDETDMLDTAAEVGTTSLMIYPYGPLHMTEQKQGDQLEPRYSSSVRIGGVALWTCRKRWTIGRRSEKRVRDIRADGTTRWWCI